MQGHLQLIRILTVAIAFITITRACPAQMIFEGYVKDRSDSTALEAATVKNINTRRVVTADDQGIFRIPADFNDRLVITAVGYLPDTLTVKPQLFLKAPVVLLVKAFSSLAPLAVYSDHYQADSLESRTDYEKVYKSRADRMISRKSVKGEPGFGLSFSPLSYFSDRAKSRRRLLKRLHYNEEQAYVDYRFSPVMVSRYTGLKGDSLRIFLQRYRPTYKYCTQAKDMDILLYINDCLREFHGRALLDPKMKLKK